MGKTWISHDTHKRFRAAHTLFIGFSVLLAAGSGCSCLPFLDGVLLILGEWNLSISFMVNEDRWDRCESEERGATQTHYEADGSFEIRTKSNVTASSQKLADLISVGKNVIVHNVGVTGDGMTPLSTVISPPLDDGGVRHSTAISVKSLTDEQASASAAGKPFCPDLQPGSAFIHPADSLHP